MAALDPLRSLWAIFSPRAPEAEQDTGDKPGRAARRPARRTGRESTAPRRSPRDTATSAPSGPDTGGTSLRRSDPLAGEHGPQRLFGDIAAGYVQPVKDFIFELSAGTATKEWIAVCMPVLGSVLRGAESLEFHAATEKIAAFRDALAQVDTNDDGGGTFHPESRALILARYRALAEAMPATFDPGQEGRRRESILVHSLLRQLPEVGHVTLEKLYAAGLTSLETLTLATPDDMSSTTGIPRWLCERIGDKVREHRNRPACGKAEGPKHDLRLRLAPLVAELRSYDERLRAAEEARGVGSEHDEARRLSLLRERQECALRIDVLLAEAGEVALVERLRRLAVVRRIQHLEQWLGPEALRAAANATTESSGNGNG